MAMHKQSYSPLIVGSPIVLFLGAGASKPFGKMSMEGFIAHLENIKVFKDSQLFREIIGCKGGRDLEHLFEELDEWSRKTYHTHPNKASRKRSGLPITSSDPFGDLVNHSRFIQASLRREVFNAYCDIDSKKRQWLVQIFEQLFATLLGDSHLPTNPLVVFTTNYDPAVEAYCQAKPGEFVLRDGFVSQEGANAATPVWHRESIDNLDMSADRRKHIVLFKLHGSTSWYKRGDEFVKSEITIHTASNSRFENLLIYPAKRKVALHDPYFTAYDYFQRTLEGWDQRKKLCIVIGYSFRDYDGLSRLRSAASLNPNLALLVIDPKAQELCKDILEPLGVQAEPVVAHFGKEIESGVPLTIMEAEDDYLRRIKAALARL